jgi:septum formation protein
MKLILASKSPRRKHVLELLGLDFEVEPADVDERAISRDNVEELTEAIACAKAEKVAKQHPEDVVLGIDTMLWKKGKFIGQPGSEEEARQVMNSLLGKTHTVCSGYCVIAPGEKVVGRLKSEFKLRNVSEKLLEEYLASGQWKGKAGGYNITDPEFENFGEKVEGSKLNIVGFPAERLLPILEEITGQKRKKQIEEVEATLFKGKL